MPSTTIKIQNCNNIASGEICLSTDKMNILYGRNGTGKSTIARAIYLTSRGKDLSELAPYGIVSTDTSPSIEGVPEGDVAVFDADYVDQYVYQPDTLIKNAFEVLIRSKEYDEAKQGIDEALASIRTTISERQAIVDLQSGIEGLIKIIKLTDNRKIDKRGGAKNVLAGKGIYFNPPTELCDFNLFFEDDSVPKWSAWRLQGYEQFGSKGRCPYCSTEDSDKTATINQVFVNSFDKPSVEIVHAIINALEAFKLYVCGEKVGELVKLFGVKGNAQDLETQLAILITEAGYLRDKLAAIMSFNGSSVNRENVAELESTLMSMKIDQRYFDTYFSSVLTICEMGIVNSEIDNILVGVGRLKGEIGKYNGHIQRNIKERRQDINDFLRLAGFRYMFDIEVNGENSARALLKFILPDGTPSNAPLPKRNLSWGEKHSFALILFMFDAIRNNAKLIILDDPISSFDSNKKYAIINRLFKTGDKSNSFYERTVLMLTHDFEPVIDFIQTTSGRQSSTSACAAYVENISGRLVFAPIQRGNDLMSSVVLYRELAMDENIDIAARIGCLRKYIEHQYRNPREESDAYNILSSLIHGRTEPSNDSEGNDRLTDEQIASGVSEVKRFIRDFDYASVLDQCAPQTLLERYGYEISAYVKMLILRAYTEQDIDARTRLRSANEALRKYVDESFHIENDYIYSLDVRRFNIVPENYIDAADRFVNTELERGN